MFVMLGEIRISINYLVEHMACYGKEVNTLHLCFTDDIRVFPVRNIEKWKEQYGIDAVTTDYDSKTVTIVFSSEKDCVEYTNYLDQYFIGN